MLTPEKAIDVLANSQYGAKLNELQEFIRQASARDLEEFLLRSKKKSVLHNGEWLDIARTSLQVRLSEDMTNSAKQVMVHTEKLTVQTDIMITESKKLGRLTWALILLTAGLLIFTAGLLWIDWHRELPTKKAARPFGRAASVSGSG